MNRNELQKLSIIRLEEARSLLERGKPDGAYYLAGYAVECALKACIAKLTKRHDFPLHPSELGDYYSHKPEALLKIAGLTQARNQDAGANEQLAANWKVVIRWEERARYQRWTKAQAVGLIRAIEDEPDGVLSWIKRYW